MIRTTKRLRRTSARRASFSDGDEGEFIPNESQSVSAPNGTSSASASGKPEGKCKGLRHFSKIVCDKVQSKQTTTYNEVADELVAEFNQYTDADPDVDQVCCVAYVFAYFILTNSTKLPSRKIYDAEYMMHLTC